MGILSAEPTPSNISPLKRSQSLRNPRTKWKQPTKNDNADDPIQDNSIIYDILDYYENDYLDLVTDESSDEESKLSIFKLIRETMDKKVFYIIGLFAAAIDGGVSPV